MPATRSSAASFVLWTNPKSRPRLPNRPRPPLDEHSASRSPPKPFVPASAVAPASCSTSARLPLFQANVRPLDRSSSARSRSRSASALPSQHQPARSHPQPLPPPQPLPLSPPQPLGFRSSKPTPASRPSSPVPPPQPPPISRSTSTIAQAPPLSPPSSLPQHSPSARPPPTSDSRSRSTSAAIQATAPAQLPLDEAARLRPPPVRDSSGTQRFVRSRLQPDTRPPLPPPLPFPFNNLRSCPCLPSSPLPSRLRTRFRLQPHFPASATAPASRYLLCLLRSLDEPRSRPRLLLDERSLLPTRFPLDLGSSTRLRYRSSPLRRPETRPPRSFSTSLPLPLDPAVVTLRLEFSLDRNSLV